MSLCVHYDLLNTSPSSNYSQYLMVVYQMEGKKTYKSIGHLNSGNNIHLSRLIFVEINLVLIYIEPYLDLDILRSVNVHQNI